MTVDSPDTFFPKPYSPKILPREQEQIIVFLYDTEYCQHEADDPQKAVLFFHPHWVSEQQRLALCGQLMGATHFCSSLFASPSVLTLQSGKFLLKKYDRYILSVGSDQSLPEWILKERFKTLRSLIDFYHCDLSTILKSVNDDHDNFISRLSQIFESYIPILQNVVSSVCSVPSIQYTNGNSSVFLEALQLLEACTSKKDVIGGVVMHNSKIVVSQLDSNINLLAALTDPYKIKNCAQAITVPFHLPVGVQLFRIFVHKSLLVKIRKETGKSVKPSKSLLVGKSVEGKRDASKIFTVHEEEESHLASLTIDVVPKESTYMKLKNRRNSKHKSENNILKERSKNYVANPNISVVSTPTVEKKLIHEEILSICSGKIENKIIASPPIPDLVQDVLKAAKPIQTTTTTKYRSLRRLSLDDQMIDLTHNKFPMPLRYYSFGFPRLCKPDSEKNKLYRCKIYKTITDPMYPVFREDGVPVTKGLYNHCLDQHYKDFLAANQTIDSQEEFIKSKQQTVKKQNSIVIKKEENGTKDKKIDQKLFRRSLTLPLKPMTLDGCTNPPPAPNKVLGVTPSTPLMAKLSLFEQPLPETKNIELPLPSCLRKIEEKAVLETREKPKIKSKEREKDEIITDSTLVSTSLFVCGHGNMTILLLLEEGAEQNPELVLQLWEIATGNLDRVETAWSKSMDHITHSGTGGSSYSFLSLDPAWGTVKKYGPWGNEELKIVGSLHQDLLKTNNITEIIVRNEDAVVYGYRCGKIETFYQQSGSCSVGLPTPADLMGVVTLKARRRLERDHGIVLL